LIVEAVCRGCGKAFRYRLVTKRQVYCGDACRKRYERRTQAALLAKNGQKEQVKEGKDYEQLRLC
jgi:hypothetical protein